MDKVPKIRFEEFKEKWIEKKLGDIVVENVEPIPMPKEGYTRVGIYCHAKGTFQEYVPIDKALEVDTMYVIHKNNLIVNITFAWEHAIAITKDIDEGKIVSHRFPAYKFRDKQYYGFYKYLILDKRFKYELGLASPGGAGRNRVLNKAQFLKIPIYTTSEEEQKKIAKFFYKIDERIENQQVIVNDLKDQKNGLMQKLFNQQVRFKKSDGNDFLQWEKKDFSECFDILSNNTFSRDCLNYEKGVAKNIHYGDILIKFNTIIDINDARVPFINDDEDITRYRSSCYLNDGDIVFADTAEDYTVGKSVEIKNVGDRKVLSGLHTIPCRPLVKAISGYLGYYTNSEKYHSQLYKLVQGTKVSSISKSSIKGTYIELPCLDEQKKIVECLSAFDRKIRLEERVLDDWQTIKKGLLQQMFI